jgi:hypothetical protein
MIEDRQHPEPELPKVDWWSRVPIITAAATAALAWLQWLFS